MTRVCQHGRWRAFCTLALAVWLNHPGDAAEYLLWDKTAGRVDANIQTWDVLPLLRKVAASTGWRIYLQPGTQQVVKTRFRNLSEGDALRRLLGDLNFALVPQTTNGPATLYVFRTTRDDATELVRAATAGPQARPIEDELVVVLKPGETIEDLARRHGAKVTGQLEDWNAFRLKFADAAAARKARRALLDDPSVARVDSNYLIPLPESPDGLGVPGPRLNLQPKAPPDGQYVIVGLIDSAVQPDAGRFGQFLLEPVSVTGQTQPPSDQPTHGTAMAETLLNGLTAVLDQGRATAVRILPVDVYGQSAASSTFDVAAGIARAVEAGAKVINLSMGTDGDSWILHEMIKNARAQNILIFAAAGNEPTTAPVYPAAYPEATAVTARDRQGNVASYANRGDFVDAAGPSGSFIVFGGQTYFVAGTSASTAFVSGMAAALAETTGKPMNEVETMVRNLMPVNKPEPPR